MPRASRYVVVSHKGGSGKTVLAVNLAGAWAAAGRRVLVVDADSQGAAGRALGVRHPTKPTLAEVLAGGHPPAAAIRATSTPGLYVLPADLDFSSLELDLVLQPRWRTSLYRVLEQLPDDFDDVVIDTVPGLGVMPFVGLVAADHVLVSCPPEYLAWSVLDSVVQAAERAGAVGGGRARLLGIVPTMVGPRTNVQTEVLELMAERYGPLLLPEIPRRVLVQQAAIAGEPLATYAPGSAPAVAFTALSEEVHRRGQDTVNP
jgi:chromosome partitioning protein